MTQHVVRRCARPYLFTSFVRRYQCTELHTRAVSSIAYRNQQAHHDRETTNDYERRVEQLVSRAAQKEEWYPRLQKTSKTRKSIPVYRKRYDRLEPNETRTDDVEMIAGRVQSVRAAGSKLLFVDLKQGDSTLQAVVQSNRLGDREARTEDQQNNAKVSSFKRFANVIRKGDWYEIEGHAHRTKRGELSIMATTIPRLLSPSLHQIPEVLDDPETRARNRHVDMLVSPATRQTIRARYLVEKYVRDFFDGDGFTAVHTPLLTGGAGGAVARPFRTEATELEGQQLELRIAPELWLKRLIVGGIEKVYELGPAFRNEGVDATHNPEFYICEFYQAFAVLDDLMAKTEALLFSISAQLTSAREKEALDALPSVPTFTTPFKRLEYIPTIEQRVGHALPDLSLPTAADDILDIFKQNNLSIPSKPTLPRLLDSLASHYIEPLCDSPTFITHQPACVSPLAKDFLCPLTNQIISARAELFIAGREIANMYEEENSPFQQRQKLIDQLQYRKFDGEGDAEKIDESYVKALEWGMPPTGGWGCGVDRLVMLFTGRERLADVMPFGTLRNVVGMAKGRR